MLPISEYTNELFSQHKYLLQYLWNRSSKLSLQINVKKPSMTILQADILSSLFRIRDLCSLLRIIKQQAEVKMTYTKECVILSHLVEG